MISAGPSDGPAAPPPVQLVSLGRSEYRAALDLQRRLHAARVQGAIGDVLLLTEHEPVLTLGRKADDRYLRVPASSLAEQGIALVRTERGGDVTYHGPGQLVAYAIFSLKRTGCDVHRHVRLLEETALVLLRDYGIDAGRKAGAPGVWVGGRKIASVGVYVSRWVTMHGIAINVDPSPDGFALIHPCGLVGVEMTSIADLCGAAPSMAEAMRRYAGLFGDVFEVTLIPAALPAAAGVNGQDPTSAVRPGRA